MSLYWPARESQVVTGVPRMHAFVIGVGDYHHLGLGVDKPAKILNGLPPLTITTTAARRIARWLETSYTNLSVPLGSIELLLSPTAAMTDDSGRSVAIADATMSNVKQAFRDWYARCDTEQGNIALFYFAGHGVSTMSSDFLLPSDFGDPTKPDDWENCIDATGLQSGMHKCMADTQLFLFDACRDVEVSTLTQRNPHGEPLVNSSLNHRANVSAAFRAASEGRKAYGPDGEETYFCKALIMCLDGIAADKSGPQWHVDTAMLASSLAKVIAIMAKAENQPLTSQCDATRPVRLHQPPAPKVLVKIDCEPKARNNESTVSVQQNGLNVVSPPGDARPWTAEFAPGDVHFEATFATYANRVHDDKLFPPVYEWDPPL